jgi:hypothetical protein
MFRVRQTRAFFALCALLGALMYAGWVPHHALMRVAAAAGPLSAAEAAIAAADASICTVHQGAIGSDDTSPAPGHPAASQFCPICALHAFAVHKAPDSALQVHRPSSLPVRLAVVETVPPQTVDHDRPPARGPPALV